MWGTLQTKVIGFRSWLVATSAAVLGWLLTTLLLAVGARPLGWVILGAVVLTVAAAALYARARALRPSEVATLSFAAIMLSWPALGFLTLLILSWAGVIKWE